MAKAVTMADIAKELGISVVTVSKALRGKDGVSDIMRAKIIAIADEMGYTKKLPEGVSPGTYVIGILTAQRYLGQGTSYYWSLYEGILKHLAENGDFGFLEVISAEAEADLLVPRIVQEKRADGLIVMGKLSDSYIGMLANLGLPITMLDTYHVRQTFDTVISDGYFGMYAMTDHLISMGHRKIMFVGTVGETNSITDRYFGYCRAMMEAGIKVTDDMVIPDRNAEGKVEVTLPENLAEHATALVCNCDYTAYYVYNLLTAMQIRVPEDISIVGFDNFNPSSWMTNVSITTYGIDHNGMASASVKQIRNRIQKPYSKQNVQKIGGEVIPGQSVKQIQLSDSSTGIY